MDDVIGYTAQCRHAWEDRWISSEMRTERMAAEADAEMYRDAHPGLPVRIVQSRVVALFVPGR